jgi:hypothetical protein
MGVLSSTLFSFTTGTKLAPVMQIQTASLKEKILAGKCISKTTCSRGCLVLYSLVELINNPYSHKGVFLYVEIHIGLHLAVYQRLLF